MFALWTDETCGIDPLVRFDSSHTIATDFVEPVPKLLGAYEGRRNRIAQARAHGVDRQLRDRMIGGVGEGDGGVQRRTVEHWVLVDAHQV